MADSVTVSLLPVSLSLVHVPRSRIHDLNHQILRQLLQPKHTFLNVTCNEIELSLFAEHTSLCDFKPIARKDARKVKKVRGRGHGKGDRKTSQQQQDGWHPVEISQDKWNVLQIDSHSDSLDKSGARVHELSAPLAAAGISILYQSSYMSDFILVKEHRLAEVMSLLGSAGFDLYSSDPEHLTAQVSALASPILSPLGADDDSSIHLLDLGSTVNGISTENGAVLTRSRANTDPSSRPGTSELGITALTNHEGLTGADPNNETSAKPSLSRSQSHSPSCCDVRVLDPDLTCIGLSDESADVWGLKIVKLVAFPDLISGAELSGNPGAYDNDSEDDIDSSSSGSEYESGSSSDSGDNTTRVGDCDPDTRASSESPLVDLEQRKPWDEDDDTVEDSSSEDGGATQSRPSSRADSPNGAQDSMDPSKTSKPQLRRLETLTPSKARSKKMSPSVVPSRPLVPFFSFTRTAEGSSLTASVSLLASLFPPHERHMIACGGELDELDSQAGSPSSCKGADEVEASEEEQAEPQGTLKALQIDLRKYGLDKHGLVNRYSRTLEENGINHMYSSTFKTANLLVDKAHASRAQSLLRSC